MLTIVKLLFTGWTVPCGRLAVVWTTNPTFPQFVTDYWRLISSNFAQPVDLSVFCFALNCCNSRIGVFDCLYVADINIYRALLILLYVINCTRCQFMIQDYNFYVKLNFVLLLPSNVIIKISYLNPMVVWHNKNYDDACGWRKYVLVFDIFSSNETIPHRYHHNRFL